jgi:hypothetical protein
VHLTIDDLEPFGGGARGVVRTLFGGAPAGQPDQAIIDRLEDLLARARRGEVSALAYATVSPGGHKATGWDGTQGTRDQLGTAIAILSHRWGKSLLGDHET